MTEKTEDQISREKEAVQKMVGAKSAMESSLARIATLEGAIKRMNSILSDMATRIGDGVGYMTYNSEKSGGEGFMTIRRQAQAIEEIGRKVL